MDLDQLGMPPSGLQGKIAIVTGVSRQAGIGAAVCRAFAVCGVDIFFTHWLPFDQRERYEADEAGITELEKELRGYGVRVADASVNLTPPDAADAVLRMTIARLGPPHILVNNAAHSSQGGIDSITTEVLDAHYAVNVRAMALLCATFVRHYPGGPGGRIINLTSGQSVAPMPGELAYATSKGAIEAFTISLAPQVAGRGITVNAVDPGGTDTGWMTDEQKAQFSQGMAMGRVGRPEDAARLITFLASEAAGWITGQVLHSRGA